MTDDDPPDATADFDELPHAFNPPDGLWANANHDVSKRSAHFFTREYIVPARYRRIDGGGRETA